ncbi:outer membrane beta-barrel protein [Porphyromonas sp.]|uniref:outer membrane beta-barrel protein n=1 Tax=Porphyromonas sp. TaxID=1924944 RepID=UPI0026DC33E5|nr:outer membrane beta-barrel protein [Porphyromonas sp.]MDO4770467.1 outer membrane beta-barrel protein [Porphyromonas sp.]
MRKRKFLLASALATLALTGAQAQVKDVSVTVSPFVEYNWWNSNIALKNTPFWGARVGFGFGRFFELRGTFEKSLDPKSALQDKSWNVFNEETLNKLEGSKIDITRIGGEAKINLFGNALFSPYVTAGTGVQIFDYTPFKSDNLGGAISDADVKEKQIYVSLGAGLKLSLSDRMALSLEARNIRFNMDADNTYFNPTETDKDARWGNWAALASLDFYLGGNTTPRDKQGRAYYSLFTDGFRGPKFVLEPGVAFVDFSGKIDRADQWFVGGAAGFDLSSLVGIRGFYYQATKEPNTLNIDFNKDMKMYGANIITRLNYPRGIVPYLSLGVGYLDVEGDKAFKKSNLMAIAGAGIEIPVSRFIALYGTYNAMLMTNRAEVEDVTKVSKPSELINNHMYTAGVRFNLGVPAKAPIYGRATEATSEYDNDRINEMRSEMVVDRVERERVERVEVERRERANDRMTQKEFEEMVERILQKVRKEEDLITARLTQDETSVLLSAMTAKGKEQKTSIDNTPEIAKILTEISAKLDRNHSEMVKKSGSGATTTTTVVTPGTQTVVPVHTTAAPAATSAEAVKVDVQDGSSYLMNRYAVFGGVNVGGAFNVNLGVRGFMQIGNSAFDFMPELYLGLGSKTGYGLSGNVIYNMDFVKSDKFTPYVGFGLGLFNHGNGVDPGTNIIVGANVKTVGNGALFVDYSARNLFKHNQLAVGYRFKF